MIFSLSICQVIELVMDVKMFCYILSIYVKKFHVFNYPDDTSILCKHRDYNSAYNDFLSAASTMIHRYKMNYMRQTLKSFSLLFLTKNDSQGLYN